MAPQVGFEPTTDRLTADCSTTELLRNDIKFYLARQRPTLAKGNPSLPSALRSLTSVFGMGTGVTFSPSSPDRYLIEENFVLSKLDNARQVNQVIVNWLSPRTISIRQLHTSPCFHLGPINLVIFKGSYFHKGMGNLILRGASCLDAFSTYPFRT